LCAANNKCPHLGLSLSKGPGGAKFEDGQVTCPWHNSVFELSTGENLDWVSGIAGKETPKWSRRLIALGRQPKSLTTYPVTVEGADVFVTV
ncbi:Rieske (2Fe-2S) protein, partial [Nocardioides sp.]|uniref:Rieske (2Fe-2S) protein n=1 Tax=Nocardioides sp. TaxID=35761 RepID=UPI0035651BBD